MSSPVYCEQAMLKEYLGITAAINEWQLAQAIKAASRSVDNYCGRRFWLDPDPVTRTFVAAGSIGLEFPDDGIGDLTGLAVATDPAGDATYPTVWAPADYQLLPIDAPYAAPEPQPWTAIQAVGTLTFPFVGGWRSISVGRQDRVQITARWGWPAVPDAVVSACLIKAAALYHRKDSPQGIAGFGDFGVVRLSRREDTDVCGLLDPYRWLVCA